LPASSRIGRGTPTPDRDPAAARAPRAAQLPGATADSWSGTVFTGLKHAAVNIGHAPVKVAHGMMNAPAKLTQVVMGIPSALRNAPSTLGTAARKLWTLTDLRTMLQPRANDPDFLQILRGNDIEAPTDATLARCRKHVGDLRSLVQAGHGIESKFQATLLKDIEAVEQALHPLANGTPAGGRALKALANLVNLWPLVVPSPLLANQAKTFAYTVAAATKAVVGLAGTALRPTADGLPFPLMGGEMGRQADEVHFYPALLNAIFLSLEMTKKFGSESARHQMESFDDNKLGHAGIAAACGMALIAPFVWDSVQNLANRATGAFVRAGASIEDWRGHAVQAEAMRKQLTPGEVGEHVRAELQGLWVELEAGRVAFTKARADFTDPASGHELTRTLNSQVTHLLGTIGRCTDRLEKAFNLAPEADGSEGAVVPAGDTNFASKLALTIFAAGVTGATVFLIQPDPIGTVDLSADAVVVTAVMAQSAWNKQATRQDAMERFKGMAATSMVMAMALSVDKLAKAFTPKGLIEASPEAPYYAALVMTVMAMTMPGPVARGAELAMNWGGSAIASLFKGPDGRELGAMVPSSPEGLVAWTETLSEHIQGLGDDELPDFEQRFMENLSQVMVDAKRATDPAAGPSNSGVTLTEITDEPEIIEGEDGRGKAVAA
jgi:hypothetical protein